MNKLGNAIMVQTASTYTDGTDKYRSSSRSEVVSLSLIKLSLGRLFHARGATYENKRMAKSVFTAGINCMI